MFLSDRIDRILLFRSEISGRPLNLGIFGGEFRGQGGSELKMEEVAADAGDVKRSRVPSR